ncbi:MAG TPA: imidazole glycerol phosphate synthase subunit HisH [Ramlibacter sp.]|nr:imidazole glycerol phosphate synthase subunit HisH [Ramlibacter sp.]
MSLPVTVLDYGIGNQLNVLRALEHCGASVKVVQQARAADVESERLVLPGVGAFGDGMAELRERGFDDLVRRFAQTGRPFLGICVGMQVMFDASEEMGEHAGLGLLAGRVRAVPAAGTNGRPHRIPHIGWRPLEPAAPWEGTILSDVRPLERVYFVHSFAAEPAQDGVWLANVRYDGLAICAAVHSDNLYGCQFHPERSAETGLNVLRRFLKL